MNLSDKWETAVTTDDQAYYQQLYQYEGANKSQDEMAPFLRKAQAVSTQQLNQILGAAFQENTTNVDDNKKSFYIALKLIACAQHGINPSSPILSTSTPLPTFENYEVIATKDRQKYLRIFEASGPTDGFINGDKAMKILMRSKLPVSLLSQIWNLADIERQGKLDSTGFVIAMHYVAKCMNGNKKSLPHANAPDSILKSARGESPSLATMTPPKQHSTSPRTTGKPASTSPPLPPPPLVPTNQPPVADTHEHMDVFSPLHQQQPWTVNNAELASYTEAFNKIDAGHKGYIEGSEAVSFFGHSNLPSSDLAGIWDLADTQNRGQLSQNEFAIAMHLIRRIRGGSSLPSTLPPSLLSHLHTGNQATLATQVSQLKQSVNNEQKDVTELQQSVKEQDTVISDLQKQVDALEQSLQQVTKEKSDLQTTLDTLTRTEVEKRQKIAQLEKEYNTAQTELTSLKATHQQRLTLVGISNSQLASAQSLKDKMAEELALARDGKFDTLAELSPKSNEAPPPPPPSSRHHRTQSIRAQQPPGTPNKRPPAPPPSKKKRSSVPSTSPPTSDSKVTTDTINKEVYSEKSLVAAVSAGVTSVVASSALADLINSQTPTATDLDSTPTKTQHETNTVIDDMKPIQASSDTLTNATADENEINEDVTVTPESHKAIGDSAAEGSNKIVDGNSDVISDIQTIATHVESTATTPINKNDTENAKDSPPDVNTTDDSTDAKDTPSEANAISNVETTDNVEVFENTNDAKDQQPEANTISDVTATDNVKAFKNTTDAKEQPSEVTPKETLTEVTATDNVKAFENTTDAKEQPSDVTPKETLTEVTDIVDDTVTKDLPYEANIAGTENSTTTVEYPKELTKTIDNTADTNDTLQQTATTDVSTRLTNMDETSKSKDVAATGSATISDSTGDGKEPRNTATNDNKVGGIVENDNQSVAAMTSTANKDVDITPSDLRTDTDADDTVPNGSPVVVEPVDSGNKQTVTEASRTIDETNSGSPEIHTATTTASGSLKGDDHDFEVVDNASTSSSFMSASMGGDDDALDEFDAAFSETLPDAKMVLSNTTDTNTASTGTGATTTPLSNATTSGYDKNFYGDDDFDEAFDPKVFTPATATTPKPSNQQPSLDRQTDLIPPKNDPFSAHDANLNDNSFADAFAPFVSPPNQKSSTVDLPSAFGDSFTLAQPQTSAGSTSIGAPDEHVSTNTTTAPDFTDLKDLVISPEQVTDFETNPFDEPSFEHQPDTKDKDQQSLNATEDDKPIDKQISGHPQGPTIQQSIEPAPAQQLITPVTQPTQTPTQPVERGSFDNMQASSQQLQQDNTQINLQAPPTVSPSVSTTSNIHSDHQSQQSQQQPAMAGTKSADEGHTSSSTKGKHKGLFSLSSMLPKQKGKKSKSKASKKDKSGHESMTTTQQQQQPPQSTTATQHYQDPSLEHAIPAMSDQEVMANLRDFGIDSESMKTLTNMGFTVDQAKEALERYDYDVQKATNFLLDQ